MLEDEKIAELLDQAGIVMIPMIGSAMELGESADKEERPESPFAIDAELWEFARMVEAEVRERLAQQAEESGGSLTAAAIRVRDYKAWLIEKPPLPQAVTTYLQHTEEQSWGWTSNPDKAMRFATKAEAKEYLRDQVKPANRPDLIVTEHVFRHYGDSAEDDWVRRA